MRSASDRSALLRRINHPLIRAGGFMGKCGIYDAGIAGFWFHRRCCCCPNSVLITAILELISELLTSHLPGYYRPVQPRLL